MTYNEFHKVRYKYVFDVLDPFRKNIETEKQVEIILKDYFSTWFTVHTQVYSDCKKFRCDILLYHKEKYENQRPLIIEVKKNSIKQGSSLGDWCMQSKNYSETTFHGKTPLVFIFPQISGIYLEEGSQISPHSVLDEAHHNVSSFLYGGFNIGELRRMKHHEKLTHSLIINTKVLWSSHKPWVLNQNIHPYGH